MKNLFGLVVFAVVLSVFVAIAVLNDRWIAKHRGGWYE